jgi:aspartate kinase
VAKVSVVGIGMRSHAGVAAQMFQTLRDEGINIKVITTSEIKISVLIDRKYMELAVQALHDAFGLDKDSGIVGALATFGPFQIQEGRRFRVRHCFTTH